MKHRGSSKIKYEHEMIKGLRKLLESIEDWEEITSIIPARIKPIKAVEPRLRLTVQQRTPTGFKCLARSGSAVQEVFIVSSKLEALQKKIEAL